MLPGEASTPYALHLMPYTLCPTPYDWSIPCSALGCIAPGLDKTLLGFLTIKESQLVQRASEEWHALLPIGDTVRVKVLRDCSTSSPVIEVPCSTSI